MIEREKHSNASGDDEDGQKQTEQLPVPGCVVWPRPCGLWYGCCVEAGGPTVFPGSPVPAVAVLPILEN